ncbi:hypothetical protein PSAC2689_110036 [Paraburkholderia sacchari]
MVSAVLWWVGVGLSAVAMRFSYLQAKHRKEDFLTPTSFLCLRWIEFLNGIAGFPWSC